MLLPEKRTRDNIGIATLEQAVLWSLQQLRQGLTKAETENDTAIVQTLEDNVFYLENRTEGTGDPQQKVTYIVIKLKIPYNSESFNQRGGDLLSNIEEISQETFFYDGLALDSSKTLIREPENITTMEQFLVWSSMSWVLLNKEGNDKWDSEGIFTFFDNADPPSFTATLNFPLDFCVYGKTQNLLSALESKFPTINRSLISVHESELTAVVPYPLGNNTIMGNNTILAVVN